MDAVEMYCATNWVRDYTMLYNWRIGRQDFRLFEELLIPNIKKMYDIGVTDSSYWTDTDVDFKMLYTIKTDLERTIEEKDFVALYDLLNLKIWKIIQSIFNVLNSKSNRELKDFFWKENKGALKIRYPELLKQIEMIDEREADRFIRSYGTRGRVLYRSNENWEYDLYSAYSPIELGMQLIRTIDFEKCHKLYMWGVNGGFEVSGIKTKFVNSKVNIEIYIYDLIEFKRVLTNTLRRDLLLDSGVSWKYAIGVKDLLDNIDLEQRDRVYIYMTDFCREESVKLEKFIREHSINSNRGGRL